ncbi:unnamed protein product [Heligmosomoides polygyrus]|uniref:Uncharacterized protein n=1 Tax=Heligmosomoides polygyrus TaxID=6339 RepID=A0A183FAJ4_HELPZ|nr:unnamed protein product [Heligmosomoides polygyrus]
MDVAERCEEWEETGVHDMTSMTMAWRPSGPVNGALQDAASHIHTHTHRQVHFSVIFHLTSSRMGLRIGAEEERAGAGDRK